MDKILALYDIKGIQDYIFSSNKVKENVGASIIVQQVFDDFFSRENEQKLETLCKDKEIIFKWKEITGLNILKDDGIGIEVIYIGGGNAMAAFCDKPMFETVTRELSNNILEKTGGQLQLAVALITIGNNFEEDNQILLTMLNKNKYETPRTFPLPGIAITREGVTDGLPAYKREENDEYISFNAHVKREVQKNSMYFENRLLDDNWKKQFVFSKEFDHLGQVEGDNHIAVVHIDGNNIGNLLNQQLKGIKDYNTAVNKIKQYSKQVSDRFTGVMKRLVKQLIRAYEDEIFKNKLNLNFQEQPIPLYIRPLVLDGDDVTFVVDGRIGVPTAEEFLKQISKEKITLDNTDIPLSACAGVAIVKSHFPFYRAYQLALDLCDSAKTKGKLIAAQKGNQNDVGNWLDYHIVHSGVTVQLNKLRATHYSVPGMKPLDPLQHSKYGKVLMKHDQFHLLWRPWCVAGNVEEHCKWENLKQVLKEFKDEYLWPRSRRIKLRNESIKSESDIEFLISQFESRRKPLPLFDGKKDYFRDNQSPYFDALELSDFYLDIPGKEAEQ